jgi:membrane protein implicated in regulation of membrane protease activity
MKLFYACLIYVLMGAILAAGVILTVKGSPWLLIISFLAYVVIFAKVGCLHH